MRADVEKLIQIIKGMADYPNAECQGIIEFSEYESEENFIKTNFGETSDLASGALRNGEIYLYSYENRIPTVEGDAVVEAEDDVIVYLYLLN